MTLPAGPDDAPPPHAAGPGVVTLENVGFRCPGADRRVLSGLHFTAYPGLPVLVDGPSGAGKSTLAKLLLRSCRSRRAGCAS
ncbi:hypothetical protein ACYF6T_08660 [Streptomyces sp. 7R007]